MLILMANTRLNNQIYIYIYIYIKGNKLTFIDKIF